MPQTIHSTDRLPPSGAGPSERDKMIHDVNQDYELLFRLLLSAIEFFDRCDDCQTLIDACKLFRYLDEIAEDCLEEVWEAS